MPRTSLLLAGTVLVLAGCGFASGQSSKTGEQTTAPPATVAAPPPTTVAGTTIPTPLVGTIPRITAAGATTTIVVPPPPPTDTVAPAAPAAAPAAAATTAAGAGAGKATTTTTGIVAVQAGAFTTKQQAQNGLAQLTAKGFAGFAINGTGPYRLRRENLPRADAKALVQKLNGAGFAAVIVS
jgi:cell division septation protein DedD